MLSTLIFVSTKLEFLECLPSSSSATAKGAIGAIISNNLAELK